MKLVCTIRNLRYSKVGPEKGKVLFGRVSLPTAAKASNSARLFTAFQPCQPSSTSRKLNNLNLSNVFEATYHDKLKQDSLVYVPQWLLASALCARDSKNTCDEHYNTALIGGWSMRIGLRLTQEHRFIIRDVVW
jgi:hypothetical protein